MIIIDPNPGGGGGCDYNLTVIIKSKQWIYNITRYDWAPDSFTARGPVTLTAILFPQPAV